MMQKRSLTLTCKVDSYRSGWSIVDFLAHRFPYHTREGWTTRVCDEWVHVNDAAVSADHVVRKDDAVAYTILHAEPPVDDRYQVVFEDEHYLAVAKSGNIPVHACGIYIVNTLIARLRADFGENVNLVHRLDRETSGVVVLAKHKEANRLLARMFERGEVAKEYVAIVHGRVAQDEMTIDAPIGKIDARFQYPVEYAWGKENDLATYLPKRLVDPAGKQARTRVRVMERHADVTAVAVLPEQGRTNQIRVHLSHAGHPIVGDKIYSLSGEVREEQLREGLTERVKAALLLPRHALHCQALSFTHPLEGSRAELCAPVPEDMSRWLS